MLPSYEHITHSLIITNNMHIICSCYTIITRAHSPRRYGTNTQNAGIRGPRIAHWPPFNVARPPQTNVARRRRRRRVCRVPPNSATTQTDKHGIKATPNKKHTIASLFSAFAQATRFFRVMLLYALLVVWEEGEWGECLHVLTVEETSRRIIRIYYNSFRVFQMG